MPTKLGYNFSNSWFDENLGVWDQLIPSINPTRILEVGSFEGNSTCYLIDKLASEKEIEIHCVDTWEGGIEHKEGGFAHANMNETEKLFKQNTQISIANAKNKVNLAIHKGLSSIELSRLIAAGKSEYFDFRAPRKKEISTPPSINKKTPYGAKG